LSRISSAVLIVVSIGKGGVRASLSTRISRALTSTRARRDLGVDRVRGAAATTSRHGQHVFAAHVVGGIVGLLRDLRPRHHLAEPFAVAEVDEDHAAEVAAGGGPAHERHRLPDVLRGGRVPA
jgi:hypothetical protein